ncbi:hypothetical protein VNO77_45670 [Canavalia gladiata]|uniref:Uncharacterized protein n=1 Tax=Canavalia gladiata TaxID=3824 RepID=A0AAN9JJZ5_CANGL
MPPSSSGSGHLSFKEAAGIRLPLGFNWSEHRPVKAEAAGSSPATPGFELGKKDLQSPALPLGHAAK